MTILVDIPVLFANRNTRKTSAIVAYALITRRYNDVTVAVDYAFFSSLPEIG